MPRLSPIPSRTPITEPGFWTVTEPWRRWLQDLTVLNGAGQEVLSPQGVQEELGSLDGRLDTAEATLVAQTDQLATLEGRVTITEAEITTLELTKQDVDATLTAVAGLLTVVDTVPYFTGVDTAALMAVTPFARTLLDDGTAATARATLEVFPASETVAGLVELATAAETITGTDTTRAVTPAGLAASTFWTRQTGASPLLTNLVAYWKLEEVSGTRADSVGSNPLTDMGGVTQVAGKLGQAAAFAGGATNYLRSPDTPALSVSNADFTLAGWFYLSNTVGSKVLVSKGNDSGPAGATAYCVQVTGTQLQFLVGNGTSRGQVNHGTVLAATTWYHFVAWHDSVSDTINLSLNNSAAAAAAWAGGCFDDAFELCLGRWANFNGGLLSGRLDSVGLWKRLLTAAERTDLYNGGTGLDYPFVSGGPVLQPATTTDRLFLGTTAVSVERLEVDGALKLGTALGTVDGTLRWTGTDFEGRKAGAWASLTGVGLLADAAPPNVTAASALGTSPQAAREDHTHGLTDVTSGTYTPTLTAVANVSASGANPCQYMQVGGTVTVSGVVAVTPTAAANTWTRLGLSLPVASALATGGELAGVGAVPATSLVAAIAGDAATDRAELSFLATATSNQNFRFTFTYRVL